MEQSVQALKQPLTVSKTRFLKKASGKIPFPEKISAVKLRVHTGKECLAGIVKLSSAYSSHWSSQYKQGLLSFL